MGDLDSQTRPKAVTDGHIYKGFPKRSFDETAGRSDWELASSLRRERRLLKSDWHLGLPQIRQAILHQSPSSFQKLCRTQCGLFEHTLILWLAQTKNCGFFRYRLISLRSHGRLTNENQEQHSAFLSFKFSWSSHLNLVLVWISLRVLIELFREQPLIFLNQVSPVHHHHPLQPPRKTGKSKTEKKTKTWKYSGQSDVKGAFNIFYIS